MSRKDRIKYLRVTLLNRFQKWENTYVYTESNLIWFILQSTYCSYMEKHAQATKRNISIVNLDPAAEHFSYNPVVDIRDLISVEDVMQDEELKLGPNGGLIYCME